MKIIRLYLKNFASIWAAMSLKEVDIDFTKCENKITLVVGGNGSGKTSLLSQMHPFHSLGSLDLRNNTDMILEGKDGHKIFEFSSIIGETEHFYRCEHIYKCNKSSGKWSVSSSFIKDGIELNSNGNVRSFLEILEAEFNINQAFLKLIRLGPNVADLISLKASERKEFISSLLSEVEEYQSLFDNISTEARTITSQLKLLSKRFEDIPDIDKLHTMISDENDSLDSLNKLLTEKLVSYGQWDQLASNTKTEISSSEIFLKENINALDIIRKYNSIITTSDKPIYEKFTDCERLLIIKNSEYDRIKSDISRIKDENITLKGTIKNLESQIELIFNNGSLEDSKKELSNVEKSIDEVLSHNEISIIDLPDKDDRDFKSEIIDLDDINSALNDLFGIDRNAMEYIKKLIYGEKLSAKLIQSIKEKLDFDMKKLSEKIARTKIEMQMSSDDSTAVLFVPTECKIAHQCPYYYTREVQEKPSNDKLTLLNEKFDTLINVNSILNQIQGLFKMIQKFNDMKYISLSGEPFIMAPSNILLWIFDPNQSKMKDLMNQVRNEYGIYLDKYEYDRLYKKSELLREYILSIENSSAYKIIEDSLNSAKCKLTDNLKLLEDLISKERVLDEEIDSLTIYHQEVKSDLDIYNEYMSNSDKYKKFIEIYNSRNSLQSKYLHYCNMRDEISKEVETLKFKIKQSESRLYDLKFKVNTKNNLSKEMDALSARYEYVVLIRKALSKDGIQAVFMNLYLQNTQTIANRILHTMFGDNITLLPMELDSTNFLIPYIVNGIKVADVAFASQGERSTIAIALSFAILHQFTTNYNILLLDEMDGPLYRQNKEKFLRIVENQMDQIGSDQAIVITHSNIFENYPVDLIVTSDIDITDYSQSNIIWHK